MIYCQKSFEIIDELIAEDRFVTNELFISVLLDRFNLTSVQSLLSSVHCLSSNPYPIESSIFADRPFKLLPVLDLIWEINCKVNSYIQIYVNSRLIVSMIDLDRDLTMFLKSYNIPSVSMLKDSYNEQYQHTLPINDPNEIDLDDVKSNEYPSSFTDWGIGCLSNHPLILQYYRQSGDISTSTKSKRYISSDEVYSLYFHFYVHEKSEESDNSHAFRSFLLNYYATSTLYEIGIIICRNVVANQFNNMGFNNSQASEKNKLIVQGMFSADLIMLARISQAKHCLFQDLTSKADQSKSDFHLSDNVMLSTTSSSRIEETKLNYKEKLSVFRLKDPSRGNSLTFLKKCRDKLSETSLFSPSFMKLSKVVRNVLLSEDMSQLGPVSQNKQILTDTERSRRKRKQNNKLNINIQVDYPYDLEKGDQRIVEEDDYSNGKEVTDISLSKQVFELIVDTITDYFMLLIGGKSYFKKRIEVDEDKCVNSSTHDVNVSILSSECENQSRDNIKVANCTTTTYDDYYRIHNAQTLSELSSNRQSIGFNFEGKLQTTNSRSLESRRDYLYFIPTNELVGCIPWVIDSKQVSSNEIGKWGEALVYNYLSKVNCHQSKSGHHVHWVNENTESKASYDIVVYQPSPSSNTSNIIGKSTTTTETKDYANNLTNTTYVEVKTTRSQDQNVFELSLWEWQFATSLPRVNYHIYRVYNAVNAARVQISVITDILQAITDRKVKLCLAV